MNDAESNMIDMVTLYMALADKTRLRILDLMREGETCVGRLTEALGESQPKISRHLAYLRSAGLVEARRDGKWIHYSIAWPDDLAGQRAVAAALDWLDPSHRMDTSTLAESVMAVSRPRAASSRRAQANDMREAEPTVSAHNELEEFLL